MGKKGKFATSPSQYIGNPDLKRFTRGTLATNSPITPIERNVFMLFVKGIQLKRVLLALKNDHNEMTEHQLYDTLRKVGFHYQAKYRQGISIPFNKNQLIFSDFVKGVSLQQLTQDNGVDPPELMGILRKIGLLYYTYDQVPLKN
jgi:hypothetical protein